MTDRNLTNLMTLIKAVAELETAEHVWVEIHSDESGSFLAGEGGMNVILFDFESLEEMFRLGVDWVLIQLRKGVDSG